MDFTGPYRALPSVIAKVRKKMLEKEANRTYTLVKKKNFDLTLEPYEATFLEMYIYHILDFLPNDFTRALAHELANHINQKLR